MKIEVTDDELALLIESLEHRYADSRAAKRDDSRFQELVDKLKAGRRRRSGEAGPAPRCYAAKHGPVRHCSDLPSFRNIGGGAE